MRFDLKTISEINHTMDECYRRIIALSRGATRTPSPCRYSHLLAGASWMDEYGNPDTDEVF